MIKILIYAVLAATAVFLISLAPAGRRDIGVVENIHGIPFPQQDGAAVITEELAHADIYLREPAVFKQLVVTIRFEPIEITSLGFGVRGDSFWLSYQPLPLFSEQEATQGTITKTIRIPLHDKLQETDRSIDIMFFAESNTEPLWKLYDISAHTEYAWPAPAQLKDYVRSVVKKERAL